MKCQNINRKPTVGSSAKRPKMAIESKAHHNYPTVEGSEEDDIAHERNLAQLKKSLKNSKPNHEVLRELMSRTFIRRRTYIIDEKKPVQEICSDYPLLRKPNYVKPIMHNNYYIFAHINSVCMTDGQLLAYRLPWSLIW